MSKLWTAKILSISTINKGRCLIAVAAKFGKTRLIDNILVEV